ncbi:MAG: FAD-linked oxidase C-terminal domain-containing protein [Synergistaceae bacterium]
MTYNKITPEILEELKEIVGAENVKTDKEKLFEYSRDESTALTNHDKYIAEVIAAPLGAEQVSKIMKLANKHLIPITPRGGATGLSGGAIPAYGGIVLSDERMNKILEIDDKNLVAIVEPGVITASINEAAAKKGLLYAGYPMSVTSCHIGGNVAENAGGANAIKYGVTLRYVLGMEVVMPTGEILTLGGKLMKDVSGYSLKQLIVGSEGTLGYTTKITLKLQPLLKGRADLLALFPDTDSAIAAVPRIMTEGGIVPNSVEYIDSYSYTASCKYLKSKLPTEGVGAVLLIQLDGTNNESLKIDADIVKEICKKSGAQDIFVAKDEEEAESLWAIRRNIDTALRETDPIQSDQDTVVPISSIPEFDREIKKIAQIYDVKITMFGHAGDGNLHPTILKKDGISMEEWEILNKEIEGEIFKMTTRLNGKISGEHGIGIKRKEFFEKLSDKTELEVLKTIKKALDPNNILNPGKIFDL